MEYYIFFEDRDGNLHQVGHVNGAGMESEEIMSELWKQIEAYLHDELGILKIWYYNIWNKNGFTIVDFGRHFEFLKILPIAPLLPGE